MSAGGLSICVCPYVCGWVGGCVCDKKHGLTARKSPQNGSLPLGIAIHILEMMPRKLGESSVECCAMGF